MRQLTWRKLTVAVGMATLMTGCSGGKVDFTQIKAPPRSEQLAAYDVFVGQWDWQAEVVNAENESDRQWTGAAEWAWALDNRCLMGRMSAASTNANFDVLGMWSWHPAKKQYIWSMYNNWGFPQQGTARYNASDKTWTMSYTGVGLDGTTSHGVYTMKVVDNDTLNWHMTEWADAMHSIQKIEMTGTYKRRLGS